MDINDERLEPVISAIEEGKLKDVKNLLAPLDISARSQLCLVILATLEEQADVVNFFLQNDFVYTCDELKESEGTPLHIAVEKENLEIIEMILEKMRKTHDILKTFSPFSARLMHLTISKGNKNVLELILNYHDPCVAVQKLCGPFKGIHLAVEKGYLEIARLLLQGGVSVNYRYPTADAVYAGCTILHRAVQLNHTALFEMLLNLGANVNAEWGSVSTVFPKAEETESPLESHESVMNGTAVSVVELTAQQSDIYKESDKKQTTASASNLEPISYADILHETDNSNSNGANGNAEWQSISTSYAEAADTESTLQGDKSVMNGITVSKTESTANQSNNSKESDKTQTAANASNIKTVSFSEPSFGARDMPLHIAIKNGNEQLVKLLLEYNADVDAQDSQGKTVLQLAVEKGCPKSVTHVLNYCPDVNHAGNKAAFYISQLKSDGIGTELRSYFTCFYNDDADNFERLYNAVHTNYFTLAQKHIKHGANIHGVYEGRSVRFKGRTLLHVAAINGTEQLIKLILDNGADANAKSTEGESPLVVAIQNSNLDAAKQLFLATKTSVQKEPKLFITALERDCPEMVVLCIRNGANINKWLKYPLETSGFISFDDMVHEFITKKRKEKKKTKKVKEPVDEMWPCLVAYRQRMGITTKKVKSQECIKLPPLCIAAVSGFPKVVETLLKYSPKILFVEFHYAVLFDRRDVVQILLDKESEFDHKMENFGTFVWCAEVGHAEMLEFLLTSGANIDQIRKIDGNSALHIAAATGNIEVMKLLLNRGAKVDVNSENNSTPLFTAVETYTHSESHDRLLTVKELLKFGASINCENSEGKSILFSAVLTDQPEPLQTLLEYGSVDAQYVSPITVRGLLEGLKKVSSDFNHPFFYKDTIWTADILMFHTVKMKAAGLYSKEENVEPTLHDAKVEEFSRKCCAEIAEMKRECIDGTDVTFHDILTQGLAKLACFAKNCGLSEIIKSEYCKTKFPVYGDLVKNQFEKGEIRRQLLERGANICLSLCNYSLTFEIVEKILSHLSNKDLRTVIQADIPQLKRDS